MGLIIINLCDFLPKNFVDEDLNYIQNCFCALFPTAKMCDFEEESGLINGCHYKIDSSVLHSFMFPNHNEENYAGSLWDMPMGNKCTFVQNHQSTVSTIFKPSNNQLKSKPNHVEPKVMYSDLLKTGIDKEDLLYLKQNFKLMLIEKSWPSKVDNSPAVTDSDDKENLPVNSTGCVRTEGYQKINKVALLKKRNSKTKKSPELSEDLNTPYSKRYKSNKESWARETRNYLRSLSTAYETIIHSDLLKVNELKFRKKKLRLGKSEIHGYGIFAEEHIAPKEFIIEYVGEIIRPTVADMREKIYKRSGIGSYCFRVDEFTILDATKGGNLNRFINHSCSPNSYAKVLLVNNKKKIAIYSRKDIKIGEEITYNYKMALEDEKVPCLCRARSCRKFLN